MIHFTKAVELPNYDYVKGLLRTVANHTLKLREVIGLGRICSVNVMPAYRNAVLLGKSGILTNLPFDRFLTLLIRRISSVNYTVIYLPPFKNLWFDCNIKFSNIQVFLTTYFDQTPHFRHDVHVWVHLNAILR